MGITGSYAGQLFGLLVGFGLAMLKLTLSRGRKTIHLPIIYNYFFSLGFYTIQQSKRITLRSFSHHDGFAKFSAQFPCWYL